MRKPRELTLLCLTVSTAKYRWSSVPQACVGDHLITPSEARRLANWLLRYAEWAGEKRGTK